MVQLAWLPKPNKTPSVPKNLRSIALMAADTKLFMTVIKNLLLPQINQHFSEIPQFAYRQQAGTHDALLRGSQHCSQVRSSVEHIRSDHVSKLLGLDSVDVRGGFMISLDLAKAFDSLTFRELYESLRECGVCDEIAWLLVEIHRLTLCLIKHAGHEGQSRMLRGLRQGCPAAPFIFAAWTFRVCRVLGVQWCQDHLSFFADDIHSYWCIDSRESFQTARADTARVINTLHSKHMQVNLDKSTAVLLLRGREASGLKQRHTRWSNNSYWIKVGSFLHEGKDIWLPLGSSFDYLGATLSYGSFEQQTFKKRAGQAWTTFHRLRPALRVQGPLGERHRLRLFSTFILATLYYGLVCVGVGDMVYRGIISTLAQMLRKVLRIYEHGISNQQVLLQAGIDPAHTLLTELSRRKHSIEQDELRCDAMREGALQRLGDLHAKLEQAINNIKHSLVVVEAPTEAVSCPKCGVLFASRDALSSHYTSKHPEVHVKARITFDRLRHALFGVPVCRLCREQVFDWISLERHITEGRCIKLKNAAASGKAEAEILAEVALEEARNPPIPPDTLQILEPFVASHPEVLSAELHELLGFEQAISTLQSRCALCNQRFKSGLRIKVHWQTIHSHEWRQVQAETQSTLQSLTPVFRRPCQDCGSEAKQGVHAATQHSDKCPAMFQAVACRLLHLRGLLTENINAARGPALKQSERPPAYQTSTQSPLAKAFGKSFRASWASVSGTSHTPALQTTANTARSSGPDVAGNITTTAQARLSSVSSVSAAGLVRLRNPHSLWYVNASVLAAVHVSPPREITCSFRQLRKLVLQGSGLLMSLAAQIGFRALVRGWDLIDQQRDAAEFTLFLLQQVGYQPSECHTRGHDAGGMHIVDAGSNIIHMPLLPQDAVLPDLIQNWRKRFENGKEYTSGLIATHQHVILLLGRFPIR